MDSSLNQAGRVNSKLGIRVNSKLGIRVNSKPVLIRRNTQTRPNATVCHDNSLDKQNAK